MAWGDRGMKRTPEYIKNAKLARERDGDMCQWPLYRGVCGRPGHQVDHKQNRAEGGDDSLDNLWVLCRPHHNRKTQDEAARGRQRSARWQTSRSSSSERSATRSRGRSPS